MFKKIVVGISGGVDSAVSALLLKNKGYEVIGVFMQNWDITDELGTCKADEDYADALDICNKLRIPLQRTNFVKHYWNKVFCNLLEEYQKGYTPNPDILCNRFIKFKEFHHYAFEILGADAMATGHYARTSFGCYLEHYDADSKVKLLKARDSAKDQTLFLSQIEQGALQKTMFPLGELLKSEVKEIARMNGFEKIAAKKESMGICFIGTRNFQDFIAEYIEDKAGNFVNIDNGQVVGQHNGVHQWTLGQRSKVSGLPTAFFTAKKETKTNTIYVAQGTDHPFLFHHLFYTEQPHWIRSKPEELQVGKIMQCQFKFQHVENFMDCFVYNLEKGNLVVLLEAAKRALTPGQFATFYKDEECLGSARITTVGPSNFILNLTQQNSVQKLLELMKRLKK